MLVVALSLALAPASVLAAPAQKSAPSQSDLDATTCLWGGQRYSLGAFFCAGVGSVERCEAPAEHGAKAHWTQENVGSRCAQSKYPNESVTLQVPDVSPSN